MINLSSFVFLTFADSQFLFLSSQSIPRSVSPSSRLSATLTSRPTTIPMMSPLLLLLMLTSSTSIVSDFLSSVQCYEPDRRQLTLLPFVSSSPKGRYLEGEAQGAPIRGDHVFQVYRLASLSLSSSSLLSSASRFSPLHFRFVSLRSLLLSTMARRILTPHTPTALYSPMARPRLTLLLLLLYFCSSRLSFSTTRFSPFASFLSLASLHELLGL